MPRVTFKFKDGKERKMPEVLADVLFRRGMGTYMTRDMLASRPSVPAVEVDSAGDVWNPDLHVASKLKNQNGTWRKKPGAAAQIAEDNAE